MYSPEPQNSSHQCFFVFTQWFFFLPFILLFFIRKKLFLRVFCFVSLFFSFVFSVFFDPFFFHWLGGGGVGAFVLCLFPWSPLLNHPSAGPGPTGSVTRWTRELQTFVHECPQTPREDAQKGKNKRNVARRGRGRGKPSGLGRLRPISTSVMIGRFFFGHFSVGVRPIWELFKFGQFEMGGSAPKGAGPNQEKWLRKCVVVERRRGRRGGAEEAGSPECRLGGPP